MKKEHLKKVLVWFTLITILNDVIFPTAALALTTGPSQPEVQSFEPVATSEMVDLFSGDFNYNIPLLDVDGYPINISYHSGITMDQEASWVGLGWNINAGVVNRDMRGLPDDFNGGSDQVVKENNIKDNITVGVGAGLGVALAGFTALSLNVGLNINYNNYVGMGIEQSLSLTLNSSKSGKGPLSGGLGFNSSNTDGLTISPSVSFSAKQDQAGKNDDSPTAKVGIGTSYNSRVGLKALTITTSVDQSGKAKNHKSSQEWGSASHASTFSFGAPSFIPQVQMNMKNASVMFNARVGGTIFTADITVNGSGYFATQFLETNTNTFPAYGYMYEHNGANLDRVMLDFNREKDGEFSVNTPGLPVTNHTYDIYSVSGQGAGGSYRLHRNDAAYVFDSKATNTNTSVSLGASVSVGDLTQVGVDVVVTNLNTTSGKWTGDNHLISNLGPRGADPSNPNYEPAYFKQAGEKTANIITSNSIPAAYPSSNVNSSFVPNSYASLLGSTPVRDYLEQDMYDSFTYYGTEKMVTAYDGNKTYTTNEYSSGGANLNINYNKNRDKRSEEISYLKKSESSFMLNPSYANSYAKPNHIGQMSISQPNGQRYIYGKPLYNITQREVSFNSSGHNHCLASPQGGYVNYSPDVDNSINNQNGVDHYFSRTTLPAYAHSYLLTAVLSPDYVDLSGNGPSYDDFGNYTSFEYQANNDYPVSGNTSGANTVAGDSAYNWRTPYAQNMANYNENFKTRDLDDQGNYVYGKKETAYLHYVKTKNYVAVFQLNDPTDTLRADAWGAAGENGGLPTATYRSGNQSRYLKSISLYSRADFESAVTYNTTPTLIKRVNFEYAYTLCPGIENFNPSTANGTSFGTGKLTLTKLFFTYGNSTKGLFSPYVFTYCDPYHTGSLVSTYNHSYDMRGYNRWGNYKPEATGVLCSSNSSLSNAEFPYVTQDQTTNSSGRTPEDDNASSWELSSIKLPSGGIINIDYESDDYAYVQDKSAMQMFQLVATGTKTSSTTFSLNTGFEQNMGGTPATSVNTGFIINLQTNNKYNGNTVVQNFISTSNTDAVNKNNFINTYLKDLITGTNMYFRTYMKVNGASNNGYEFVSGYAQINPASVIVDAVHNTAYFELSQTQIKIAGINSYVNPVCKAALNFGRIKTTREAFDVAGEPSGTLSPGAIIGAMLDASFLNTTLQTLQGPEDYLYNTRGLGHTIIPTKSWFRLYNPYGDKLGGGSRVKQIVMKDNWNTMVGNAQSGATNLTSYYGQSYDYTINQTINGTTLKVSSGVASYEPMAGGDENPFRMPLYSGNHPEAALAPDNRYYVEEPFGETLFPSATVGYSQVTTTNLVLDENGVPLSSLSTPLYVTKHGTGYVVNQFYTAKDYPLKTTRTDMNVKEAKSGLGGQILRLDLKHYMTASQGYVVEMNDMHGKAKATWVYAQGQSAPLSGKQYFYRDNYVVSNGVRTPGNQLLNENVPVVDGNGNYYSSGTNVGIDYDFITDFREEETVTETVGANINFYVFYVVVPLAIPPIWPMYSKESTRLRTAVTTKVINRYGILDQVVAYQNGSTVSTQNELWDGETGEVLLTKANNEYDDTTFSMTYPAHWAYQGMSPAYINDLLTYTYTGTALTGSIQSDLNTYFAPGDVVIITGTSSGHTTPSQAVVSQIGTNNVIIDYYNSSIPSLATYGVGTTIKVIRPGRRNMQSLPIGTITSLNNPVPYTTTQGSSVFSILSGLTSSLKIISASATEYSDIAKLDCGCLSSLYPSYVNSYGIINPYLVGLRGCWHPKTVYSFLTNRSEVQSGDKNTYGNMRTDGTFTTFSPFWNYASGSYFTSNPGTPNVSPAWWTFTKSLSIYSTDGHELENRDALNRYSAATYGYDNMLPLSISNNSRFQEVGFDGFEDRAYNVCNNNLHFGFVPTTGVSYDYSRAHTGKYSLKVNNGSQSSLISTYTINCINQSATSGSN